MTGLVSIVFMGFSGITLDKVTEVDAYPLLVQESEDLDTLVVRFHSLFPIFREKVLDFFPGL